ncbi:peptidoglycan-binding domain-containing protein [Pseudorhodobacter turbinis]|nr:peptidoglycan-binding domain-containing protein [Pseudorhodobacter turbinis]
MAYAADANGKFGIKGGGLQTCESFTEAMEKGTADVALYGGWIEGFITAQNQHNENTYDIAPWQTTSTMLELTKSLCNQAKPNTRFIDAFAGVFRILFPARLQQESAVVGVSNGEARSIAYVEVLKRVQQALRDEGYEIADDTGAFDQASIRQLMDYQTKNGLVATGLPDQPTLYALFFKK